MVYVLSKIKKLIKLIIVCFIFACSKENAEVVKDKQDSNVKTVEDQVESNIVIYEPKQEETIPLESIDEVMSDFFTRFNKNIKVRIYDVSDNTLGVGTIKYKPDGNMWVGLGSGYLSFHLLHVIETPESKEYYFTYTLLEGGIDETNALFFKAVVSLDDFKETLAKYEANEIKYFNIEVFREELGNKYPDYLPAVKMPWDE